jgi:hypothetical protein
MSFRALAQHWPLPSTPTPELVPLAVLEQRPIHDVGDLESVALSDVVRLRCHEPLSREVIALILGLPNLQDLRLVAVHDYPRELCALERLQVLTIDASPTFVGLPKEADGLKSLRLLRVHGVACDPK